MSLLPKKFTLDALELSRYLTENAGMNYLYVNYHYVKYFNEVSDLYNFVFYPILNEKYINVFTERRHEYVLPFILVNRAL